ncbi:TPA: tyrosine-type recombinase/integrase [Staphylococcus delphini]|nr:tyrosine-type recombinase/integrase [Staphylococcus delphini]HEC2192327.1 tyrosine-type recombinase/integrase [Staphylococcus delphini]HEC2230549.1 tyrosine-type recombinase/integrase [Staphylococcus delphini]
MKKKRNKAYQKLDNPSIEFIKKEVMDYKKSQNLAPKTLGIYKRLFTEFYEFFGKDIGILMINQRQASAFINYLLNDKVYYLDRLNNSDEIRGIQPTTVNTYLKACKSVYQTLIDLEYIEVNPFQKLKTVKRQKERVKTIPEEDIKTLINGLDKEYYTDFRMLVAIHVLLDTMGRIEEVLNIKRNDIDFDACTIYFGQTKTNEYRFVPFSKITKKLLIELLEENKFFESEYVFLTQYGTQLTTNSFRACLKRYVKTFNIKTNITPHMFRYTAATMFLQNGGNVHILQKILGHKKITTTEIYTHLTTDDITNQSEKYGAVVNMSNKRQYNKIRNKRRR